MKKAIEHLEAALKILKPKRDAAKEKYDSIERRRGRHDNNHPMWHEFVVYHNMCANIIEALDFADKRPDLQDVDA
ncbi:MAG: hypothetical protein IJG33_16995 [Selenomonadaceae bacterium]|nr:hypothetical protein [Selenomonadaceae bacterium]MBQ6004776.1 hypothetical protein [Selenomonadaceae bacterium]